MPKIFTIFSKAAGIAAISLAAFATFFIVKSTRKAPVVQGSVRVDSVPAGAAVSVDGKLLSNITPLTINNLPAGTSHDLVLTMTRHKQYSTRIEVPKTGGVIPVTAIMTPITGTLRVTNALVNDGTLAGTATSFGSGAIVDNSALVVRQASDATMANATRAASAKRAVCRRSSGACPSGVLPITSPRQSFAS